VRGIGFVNQFTRVLTTALCAYEYLDFDIKGWIVSLNTFEEQLTAAKFAVCGWQWFQRGCALLPPSFDKSRNEWGNAKKGPVNSDFEESPTR